jgi:hypothetical protein
LVKIGAGIVKRGRLIAFRMAEVAPPRAPFQEIPTGPLCACVTGD